VPCAYLLIHRKRETGSALHHKEEVAREEA